MSEFGAIVILAYNPKTMSVLVYERFEGLGLDAAKPAALLIVLLALVVFIVVRAMAAGARNGRDRRGPRPARAGRRLIGVAGLRVRAGSFALGPIDLAVADGEYLAVVGPSGAGKSVLLEALAGLRPAAAGRIEAGERDVTAAPPERRGIGLVGQRALLFPHLSVARNISFGPEVAGGGLLRGWPARDAARGRGGRRPGGAARGGRGARRRGLAGAAARLAVGRRAPARRAGPRARRPPAGAAARRAAQRSRPRGPRGAAGRAAAECTNASAMTTIHVTHSLDEALAVARRCVVLIDGRDRPGRADRRRRRAAGQRRRGAPDRGAQRAAGDAPGRRPAAAAR